MELSMTVVYSCICWNVCKIWLPESVKAHLENLKFMNRSQALCGLITRLVPNQTHRYKWHIHLMATWTWFCLRSSITWNRNVLVTNPCQIWSFPNVSQYIRNLTTICQTFSWILMRRRKWKKSVNINQLSEYRQNTKWAVEAFIKWRQKKTKKVRLSPF